MADQEQFGRVRRHPEAVLAVAARGLRQVFRRCHNPRSVPAPPGAGATRPWPCRAGARTGSRTGPAGGGGFGHTGRVALSADHRADDNQRADLAGLPDARDPRGLRSDAPLLDAWLRCIAMAQAGALTPMSVPGHKQRQDLTGAVVAGDAALYGGLATIKHGDALLADAQDRAARLWGADWCRFSVAGSTHGNQMLALAVGSPGQEG